MSATALAPAPQTPHGIAISDEQRELLKRTICKGATDDELALFLATAQRLGLDPFSKQIHAVKRWDTKAGREVMAMQVAIDGVRLTAQRSGEYEGQTAAQWRGKGPADTWCDVWCDTAPPAFARVGVWRKGFREPAWGVAKWESYKQTKKDGSVAAFWARMPDLMLAKCAEALALRKAFPAELSGVYTPDEMAQADNPPEYQAPVPPQRAPAPARKLTITTVAPPSPPPPHDPVTGEVFDDGPPLTDEYIAAHEWPEPPPSELPPEAPGDFPPRDYDKPKGVNPSNAGKPVSDKQRRMIHALASKAGIDEDVMRRGMLEHYGVDSTSALTMAQASDMIERLTKVSKQPVRK